MVLGDARLHPVVDDGHGGHQCTGAVPDGDALPTFLQLPLRIRQEPGKAARADHRRTRDADGAQYWRLLTTFLYFGPISLDLLFHVYFLQRYSRLLEESAGRSPAQFSWLLLYAMTSLIAISPLVSMPFLGHPLSSTLVYIWSRRNPDTRLSLFGLLVFTAPYLPWVLMGFSLVLHGSVPKDEIMGVVIGHIYYFFADVYPPLHNGSRPLDPPTWWRRLFERPLRDDTADDVNHDIAAARADLAHPEVR
jgi:Derlin-2/3